MTGSPLEAVMANEAWDEIYQRLEQLIDQHRTTLIFVNTRRLAERAAAALAQSLGEQAVTSHHGSLSREHRLDAEQRLKSGSLRALVATASLELGIDIGDVDLVCQMGSTRSIATFLQRAGRSGHHLTGTPKARLFPLSRDDLVEAAAMPGGICVSDAVHDQVAGRLSIEFTDGGIQEFKNIALPVRVGVERKKYYVLREDICYFNDYVSCCRPDLDRCCCQWVLP